MAYSKHKDLNFKIDSSEYDKLVRHIKHITETQVKRREILKIMKRQMKPIEKGVKNKTPVRRTSKNKLFSLVDKSSHVGVNIQSQYNLNKKNMGSRSSITTRKRKAPRGNLKRSIMTSANKDKKNVGVRVHPMKGKRKRYDGYYGWWLVYGWNPFGGDRIEGNDFLWKGAVSNIPTTANGMSNELEKYITRKLKRLNK